MSRSEMQGLLKTGEQSIFFQEGGASPISKPRYRGSIQFGGWNEPLGDLTPQYLPNPDIPNDWIIADMTQAGRGLPNSDFTARLNIALKRYWDKVKRTRCPVTAHIKYDDCGAPDDLFSWQAKDVYVVATVTDFTGAIVSPLSGDDNAALDITGSMTALRAYEIFPIGFEEVADADILAEVVDGFYAGRVLCGGDCGEREDVNDRLYVLTKANQGSAGLSSQVVFTIDGKETWDAVDVSTLGGVSGDALIRMGSYAIVVSRDIAGHSFISLNDLNDLDASAWELIATNYVGGVYSAYAADSSNAYLGGANGYAYKLEDPTDEPTVLTDGSIVSDNLTHVDGWGSTVVFGGENGKVLVSNNEGESLVSKGITLVDGTVITGNVTALGLFNSRSWFLAVGATLYYTVDNGDTYTEKALDANVTLINDVQFSNIAVGYLVAEVSGGENRVYRTDSSGAVWSHRTPYITGLPTADRYVTCIPVGANEVAVGGRVGVGGDGILAIAN